MFVDSHCHLNMLDLSLFPGGMKEVVQLAQAAKVTHCLIPGVSLSTLDDVLNIARQFDNLYAAVGIHPDEAVGENIDLTILKEKAQDPKVVAIGETGLDYYRQAPPLPWQQARFVDHIHLAKDLKKPLIIHTRNSAADTLQILAREKADTVGGVFHCFTEDEITAKKALELGFYISISGIITFKTAESLRLIAKDLPRDRVLIETDAPWLAPMPHRGKPNQPAYVQFVAAALADLWQCSLAEVGTITSDNFKRLFSLSF